MKKEWPNCGEWTGISRVAGAFSEADWTLEGQRPIGQEDYLRAKQVLSQGCFVSPSFSS